MGQLRNISVMTKLCFSLGIITAMCSGCAEDQVGDGIADTPLSGTFADLLKPDVNREQRLIIEPHLVAVSFPDTDLNIYSPVGIGDVFEPTEPDDSDNSSKPSKPSGSGGSSGNSSTKAETWRRVVNPENFVAPTTPIVNASVYGKYLNEKVYTPVNDLLGRNKNVYFRVFHMGYDFNQKEVSVTNPPSTYIKSTCEPGVITDLRGLGNGYVSAVGGDTHTNYLVEWLGSLEVNQTLNNTEQNRNGFLDLMSSAINTIEGFDDSTSYYSVIDTDVAKELDSKIMVMWEKYHLLCPQFGNLRALVQANNWGTVPDITLKYYKKDSALGTINLNSVNKGSANTAKGSTKVSDLAPLFVGYNQFNTREFAGIKNHWGSSGYISSVGGRTQSYLGTYTDGYHRTVIYIAAREGMSLQDALGENYGTVMSTLMSAKAPTDVSGVLAECGITSSVGSFVPGDTSGKGDR